MSDVNTDSVCESACYIRRYFEVGFFFFKSQVAVLFCTTVFKQIVSLLLSHVVQESCSVRHDMFPSTIIKLDMLLLLWGACIVKC